MATLSVSVTFDFDTDLSSDEFPAAFLSVLWETEFGEAFVGRASDHTSCVNVDVGEATLVEPLADESAWMDC